MSYCSAVIKYQVIIHMSAVPATVCVCVYSDRQYSWFSTLDCY